MFYQNTMLSRDVITSYGDCPIDVKTNPLLFHALKNIYGDEFIMPSKKAHATAPFIPIIHILYYIENYKIQHFSIGFGINTKFNRSTEQTKNSKRR